MLRWLIKFGGYTTILRVIAMGVTLAFVSALSLWMPKADYGLLAMVVSVATLAAAVAGFGQSELVVREVSPLLAKDEQSSASEYLHQSYALVLIVSTLTGLAIGGYFWFAGYGGAVSTSAGVITALLGLNLVFSGAARSQDRYFLAFGPKDLIWRGLTILAVGSLFVGGSETSIEIVAPVCALVLTMIIVVQGMRLSLSPAKLLQSLPNAFGSDRIAAGTALMLSAVALTAMNTADVFLVGEQMSPEYAAEYFPANRIALICGFFLLPFQMVVAPRIALMMNNRDLDGVRRLFSFATLLIGLASAVTALMLILGYPLYSPLFGTATAQTREVLMILVIGYAVGGLLGLPGIILIMGKRQKLLATLNVSCSLAAVVTLVFITKSGNLSAVAFTVAGFELLRKLVVAISAYLTVGVAPFSLSSITRPTNT